MMHGRYGIKAWSKHYRVSGASLVVDWSSKARDVEFTYGEHGFERASFGVVVPRQDAMLWRDRVINMCLTISRRGRIAWEGRIEDASVVIEGGMATITISAFGYWRALSDAVVSDVWSDMRYESWSLIPTTTLADRKPELFDTSFDGQIYLATQKDQGYSVSDFVSVIYTLPSGYLNKIQTFALTLDLNIPANWSMRIVAFDAGFTNASTLVTHTGATAITATNYSYSSINRELLTVTFRDDRARPTLTAAATAGTNVTVTVNSTASLAVGNRVLIGGTNAEQTSVLTIPTGTTFTCTIANNHAIGDTVKFVMTAETGRYFAKLTNVRVKTTNSSAVYADEVIRSLVTTMNGFNSSQISAVTGRISALGTIDLKQYAYELSSPDQIIDGLRSLVTSAGRYRVRVDEHQMVVLEWRDNGDLNRAFYVHGTPELAASLDQLTTRIKPVYTDASDVVTVGTVISNTSVEGTYGLARQRAVQYPTTSSTEAASWATADLADSDTINGYGEVAVERVYAGRTPWPLDEVRPGYLLIMIDLPSDGGVTDVYNRAFRVGESTIRLNNGRPSIAIMPVDPIPTTETLLAQLTIKQPVYEDKTEAI